MVDRCMDSVDEKTHPHIQTCLDPMQLKDPSPVRVLSTVRQTKYKIHYEAIEKKHNLTEKYVICQVPSPSPFSVPSYVLGPEFSLLSFLCEHHSH